MLELKDTVEMMESDDYRERFKAEYHQLKIRIEKLSKFILKIEASNAASNIEEPKHDCPDYILRNQLVSMQEYLHILELRALIEEINLGV